MEPAAPDLATGPGLAVFIHVNAPRITRQLTEAAFDKKDMARRMANLRARRGEGDSVMAALDRGEMPPWHETQAGLPDGFRYFSSSNPDV